MRSVSSDRLELKPGEGGEVVTRGIGMEVDILTSFVQPREGEGIAAEGLDIDGRDVYALALLG